MNLNNSQIIQSSLSLKMIHLSSTPSISKIPIRNVLGRTKNCACFQLVVHQLFDPSHWKVRSPFPHLQSILRWNRQEMDLGKCHTFYIRCSRWKLFHHTQVDTCQSPQNYPYLKKQPLKAHMDSKDSMSMDKRLCFDQSVRIQTCSLLPLYLHDNQGALRYRGNLWRS